MNLVLQVTVPYDGSQPDAALVRLVGRVRTLLKEVHISGAATQTATVASVEDTPRQLASVVAISPGQINVIAEPFVTVSYPVGETTVLSVQPDGSLQTRPAGTQGPYEVAIRTADRVAYAPTGPAGAVYLFPFTDLVPNG